MMEGMRIERQLIEILQFITDKVIVTGSYAEGTQTYSSDIDFYIKSKAEESYAEEIIRFLEDKNIEWGSIFLGTIHTEYTLIPLEFSDYYKVDLDNIFDIEVLGVKMKAAKSLYGK